LLKEFISGKSCSQDISCVMRELEKSFSNLALGLLYPVEKRLKTIGRPLFGKTSYTYL
jgi:hypothetical protein